VQQCNRLLDDPRVVAARVDDRVPRAAAKRVEVAVAVSTEVLRLGKEVGIGLTTREGRDVVAARERGLDRDTPGELRPAENQKSDSASSKRSTSASVL
jgi:hypothetical protein